MLHIARHCFIGILLIGSGCSKDVPSSYTSQGHNVKDKKHVLEEWDRFATTWNLPQCKEFDDVIVDEQASQIKLTFLKNNVSQGFGYYSFNFDRFNIVRLEFLGPKWGLGMPVDEKSHEPMFQRYLEYLPKWGVSKGMHVPIPTNDAYKRGFSVYFYNRDSEMGAKAILDQRNGQIRHLSFHEIDPAMIRQTNP
jgi:hypothetical protein